MPILSWPKKSIPNADPAHLITDSILYPGGTGAERIGPKNKLILGDNLRVMWGLLEEYEGKVDLIYVDPPFFTNRRYAARVGRGEDSRQPDHWELAEGYQDHWDDLDAYLEMLYPRLWLMHRLLSPTGSLYLHLDWHANSYARLLLDEIFGYDRLNNEIIWTYHGPSPIRSAFNRKHDTILFYTKSDQYQFNVDDVRMPYSQQTVETFKSSKKAGFGKKPDLERGKVPEDWWYFPVVARLHNERTGYPTQKPEALIKRVLMASSNPGDLVADFFIGSGTTAAVANRLGRSFLGVDSQWRAVHTSRSRLVIDAQRAAAEGGDLTMPAVEILREKGKWDSFYQPYPDQDLGTPTLDGQRIRLPEPLISRLDYCEVDPAWDGDLFRSVIQAPRPWREGSIPPVLQLPDTHQQVCFRAVLINGERYQKVF